MNFPFRALVSRRATLGGALAGVLGAGLGTAARAAGTATARSHAGHGGRRSRTAATNGRLRRPRGERLRPVGAADRLRLWRRLHRPRRPHRAAMGRHRGRPRDRDRAGGDVPGLDLRRTRAGPDLPRRRGRAAALRVPERRQPSAFDALPRHALVADGRRAGRGGDPAGRGVRLRVRRPAVRLPPLPLPRDAAEAAPAQGHVRRLRHRPRPRPAPGRACRGRGAAARHARARALAGARHGDERLRHQLRRRERGLCRQQHPVRLRERPAADRPEPAGAGLSRQPHRVRPDQLVPSARQLFRLLRPRHHAAADPPHHRHGDAVPGPIARAPACPRQAR